MRKSILFFVGLLLIAGLFVGGVSAYIQPSQDSQGNWLIGYDATQGETNAIGVSKLQWFAEQVNAGHASYNAKLISDIDLSGVTWTPIGSSDYAYAGTFDGNGKKISRLTSPFFSYTQNGEIKNIEILNSNIESGSYLAIFVERVLGNENIHDCCMVSSSIISSSDHTGGFIGDLSNSGSTITNCFVYDVTSTTTSQYYSSVFGAYAITNSLVGTISNCYVAESVATYTSSTGVSFGFAPIRSRQSYANMGTFSNSIFIGDDIKARHGSLIYGGFFCGRGNDQSVVMGNVVNCYHASTATISGTAYPSTGTTTNEYGAPTTEYDTKSFYETTLGWDFTNTWYWDTTDNLPKLRVFNPSTPSISAISVTSSSPAPVGSTVQVSATLTNVNEAGTVQFYTSTDGSQWSTAGNAVSIASGATSATQTFTGSSTAGLYYVKAILTVGSTTFDSHTSGVSDGQVKLLGNPTFTTQPSFSQSIGTLTATPSMSFVANANNLADTTVKVHCSISGTDTWGTATTDSYTPSTGVWSYTIPITYSDQSSTTHTYTVTVSTYVGTSWSDTNKRIIGTVTSNPYSFQTYAPPATPTAEINPATITINTATNVRLNATSYPTAPAGNTYYYQWYYGSSSTPSSGDTAITEQETTLTNPATWSATFSQTGTKYVYLKITDAAGNDPVYSARQTLSIVSMQATVTWVDPSATSYTDQFRLYLSGAGIGETKQWYYQQTAPTVGQDTQISGATSGTYTTTASALGLTPGNTYIFKCYVTTGGTTIQLSTGSITPYKKPEFTSITPPESGGVPLTITFSATATDATSIVYLLSSDDIIYSEVTSPYTINQIGTYYWKAKATGLGGVTYSNVTTFIVSDLAPVFSSATVSPSSGIGRFTVTFTASATNNPTYTWYERANGVDTQIGTGATLSYIIQNRATGDYTFRCKAVNQYGTAYSSLLTVSVGNTPQTQITAPSNGATRMEDRAVQFNASYQGTASTTFSWNFGDGGTGTGASTTHTYTDVGTYTVTCTGTNSFGSDSATITLHIIEYSPVFVEIDDITATGVTATGYIDQTPISPDTTMYLIVKSKSGQTIMQTNKETYVDGVTFDADGMPLISGQQYQIQAIANNGYGKSVPVTFTLENASREPQSHLSTIYTQSGLDRDPFNVSKLLDGGIQAYAGALGGGTVGAAIAFGLIVVFTAVGLWLRQGHFVIPMCLVLAGGWFVIGNLPGEWQPIAYTLMVICIIAIIFVLFRKQHEQ